MSDDFKFNPKNYYPPMHTAEHILNQTMVRKFGIERSFSNHIEKKKSKCDYHFNRDLTQKEISEIEESVNIVIDSDAKIEEEFIPIAEAKKKFNVSKLPDETGDKIRVITIGNYDSCLCSGIHVNRTGEVGIFKIISTGFADNVLRIRFKLLNR